PPEPSIRRFSRAPGASASAPSTSVSGRSYAARPQVGPPRRLHRPTSGPDTNMNLPKVGLGLAVLGILAGFVWEEAANGGTSASRASTAEGQEEPIRVLVVTATHGFRHTEGIEASKAFLNGVNGADFQFDVTEDPADINAQNLQNYDVLFLNNATLRIAPAN